MSAIDMQSDKSRSDERAPGQTGQAVHLKVDDDGIALLRLGAPDEKLVTLTESRIRSLQDTLRQLRENAAIRGVIVTGPGTEMFAAGADIGAIEQVTDAAQGEEQAALGRRVFGQFQELSVPVVAAIEGPCLGGGMEMALFCDVRVVSDHKSTRLGLPEVKLGIVPGFGGTQLLPRLIGLPGALDLILTGKMLNPKQALRKGVVDRIAPHERLLDAARGELENLVRASRKAPQRRLRGAAYWLSKTFLRNLVGAKVRKSLAKGQARFYEAPRVALRLCLDALRLPEEQGFAAEARALGQLITSSTCKGLVHLYFLTERAKRLGKQPGAVDLERAAVIGGGAMGGGIGRLLARRGLTVRLCDLDPPTLARAKARLKKDLDKRRRRRQIEAHEAMATLDRMAVATEWGNLSQTDLFLEAVVEDLGVKRELFQQTVRSGLADHAILATNTSSLSIDEIAEGLPHPERFVGLHFFNPPEKMPLVEIGRGSQTSPETVATACRLAVRIGKFPVVVADSPGFLVNRCLAPYLNEAALLMIEGNEPEFVDKVMLDFGMPMGPARLMDEVGFDVACKVSQVMTKAFGDRIKPSPLFAAMVNARILGVKTKGGLYDGSGDGRGPGRKVLRELRGTKPSNNRTGTRSDILHRLVYPMVDEAYRCLDEGLVEAEEDLDLGLVMGIGFPPFTGGITSFARQEGLKHIVDTLDDLALRLDSRFAPGDGLRSRAVEGERIS
jgi:3-hydroxyacyl-CoA dehydrogenase/enoyl-CoA hydratase/3-hydroxybutyryl-CoA epimerase